MLKLNDYDYVFFKNFNIKKYLKKLPLLFGVLKKYFVTRKEDEAYS